MEQLLVFAKCIHAVMSSGVFEDKRLKKSMLEVIRKSTEVNNYHYTTNYRTKEVEKILNYQSLGSAFQYHKFCSNNFRHEHVVPVSVIYQLLLNLKSPTEQEVYSLLKKFCLRATITKEEDKKLKKSKMPKGFFDDKSSSYFMNPLARYIECGLDKDLVCRPSENWALGEL